MFLFKRKEKINVKYVVKKGEYYKNCNIKPLDLLLFKGGDFVSDSIRKLSRKIMGGRYEAGKFSHVGVVISREILNIPILEYGKLYIWEATMSGKLGGDVYNVQGDWFLGVQIRDFDEVIQSYDKPDDTRIAYARLKNYPEITPELKNTMFKLYDKYNGRPYELNFMQLFGALYPKARCCRPNYGIKKFIFCSELAGIIYKELGIFNQDIEPYNIVPADFICDNDKDKADLDDYFEMYKYIHARNY